MKISAIIGLLPVLACAEPQPPAQRRLDADHILPVAISTESDTLLMFPKEVSLIHGLGLTAGKEPGLVHYQQAEDPKLIVVRQLEEGSEVFMKIVMDGQGFVFRLSGSEEPASIIRFREDDGTPVASEITEEEVRALKLKVPLERQEQLLRLAHGASALKPKIPQEYEGFRSVDVSYASSRNGLVTHVFTVARFEKEDAIVFLGRVQNDSGKEINFGHYAQRLKIGDKRVFQPSQLRFSKLVLAPGEQAAINGILIGDGRGGRLHLSPDNSLSFWFEPKK